MKSVCALTRIKDEEQLIFNCLLSYYSHGIRNFYITFNNSNEETRKSVFLFFSLKNDAVLYSFDDKNTRYEQIEMFDMMSNKAYNNGHIWQIPFDADEILFLKKQSLKDIISKYDSHEYGYINFRWIDYIPTKKDDNYFLSCEYRHKKHRGPTKIIYKWHPECRHGHGNHLLIAKRKLLCEYDMCDGFYAHFPNRSLEQIKNKRIRIGEAFVEKYGSDCDKPQVQEYRKWESQGDTYFKKVWSKIQKDRSKKENFIYDPIPKEYFEL